MTLDDFVSAPRGPALFECYRHPTPLPSPCGDFIVELHAPLDRAPTPAMVEKAAALARRFSIDAEALCRRIHGEYAAACDDPGWRDWLAEHGVPRGLSLDGLAPYLDARSLVVAEDLTASVYVSPAWDVEHGLYYDWTGEAWEKGW